MVGDFQQSIFGARADLAHYRQVHDTLLETGAGEALEFSVTFRLDDRAVAFVNASAGTVILGCAPLVGLTFGLPGNGRIGFLITAALWAGALLVLPSEEELGGGPEPALTRSSDGT